MKDSIVYITGHPCSRCLRGIIQRGAKRVVYGDRTAKCIDDSEVEACNLLVELSGIKIERIDRKRN